MENVVNNERKEKSFISLQHLVKVYHGGEKAVFDFDLDIERNEFIVIVGPSGCGKSTTLRMIAGLEDISDGDIYLENELLNFKPCKDRHMAIVFQSYALYPQMNVYNNIAFPLTINSYPMPKVKAYLKADSEIENLLKNVPWDKFVGVLYNVYYSKGQAKDEQIATLFDITLTAAKILYSVFSSYKKQPLESLIASGEEIKAAIRAELKPHVDAENTQIAEKGIRLDEEFCEVDESGNRIIEHRKFTPYEIKTQVYETAEKLDLTPYLDKLPKELSGGQMQRVALGRAIVKNVPVFLMDEPLSNLDAKLRLTMRSEIVKLHDRINATTIYVTHDQTEAMTMATRIVVMSKGFIQQIGAPEEIYNDPRNIFVAKFIGSPSMNIFELNLNREERCLEYGDLKVELKDGFLEKHDAFYSDKLAEFSALLNNFDEKASESILKVLSATGDNSVKKIAEKKRRFFDLFKRKKHNETVEPYAREKGIAEQKCNELKVNLSSTHKLLAGIRPERIKIEKYDPKKQYKNSVVVKPTICELLGDEYNVHFEYCGINMVGQISAKEKVTNNDEIAVSFSFDDIYLFDPVTGEVIK